MMTPQQLLPILAGLFAGSALALNVVVLIFEPNFRRLGATEAELRTLRLGCIGILLGATVILFFALERAS